MTNTKKLQIWPVLGGLWLATSPVAWAGECVPVEMIGDGYRSFSDCPSEVMGIIEDQRNRQVARQISDNINRRISQDLDVRFAGPVENRNGASADGRSLTPDSAWSTFSWSRISNDANIGGSRYDTDIYQSTSGIDYKVGNFYVGGTLTYAGTTSDIGFGSAAVNGSVHSVGVMPYAAYVFNKHVFLTAMSGYTYSNNNNRNSYGLDMPESETDVYQSELDLNGLHVIGQWFMKGKIGMRYLHGHTKTDRTVMPSFTFSPDIPASRSNSDSWTYLVDSEFGYRFSKNFKAFNGVLFEYHNPSHDLGLADGVFYYSAGFDYSVNNKLSVGTKVQTDLTNEDVDLTTVALTARIALD